MRRIGEDVSEQLEFAPAHFRVIRHIPPNLACTGEQAASTGIAADVRSGIDEPRLRSAHWSGTVVPSSNLRSAQCNSGTHAACVLRTADRQPTGVRRGEPCELAALQPSSRNGVEWGKRVHGISRGGRVTSGERHRLCEVQDGTLEIRTSRRCLASRFSSPSCAYG